MSHHKKGEMKPDKAPMPDKDMKDTSGAMQDGKQGNGKASAKKA